MGEIKKLYLTPRPRNRAGLSACPRFCSKCSGWLLKSDEDISGAFVAGACDSAWTRTGSRPRTKTRNKRTQWFRRSIILELAGVADTKLKPAGAAVVLIMTNRDTVVEPQGTDRQVQADAETEVVIQIVEIVIVG